MPESQAEAAAQIEAAKRIRLDPDRQKIALRRIAAAREVVAYHEDRAAAERATMQVLTRTWELCPLPGPREGGPSGSTCCADPERCIAAGYKPPASARRRQTVDIVSERT